MIKFSKHKGFSVLMALGITAILMIVVSGIAAMYAREFRLSRLSYDEVLASNSAEWMFEYAMLKVHNHADGFADEMDSKKDLDGEMFHLSQPRSEWMEVSYKIEANSQEKIFEVEANDFLVIPLGIGTGKILSNASVDPEFDEKVNVTKNLKVSGENNNFSWTIAATAENAENIAFRGSGSINENTNGTMELRDFLCVYTVWGVVNSEDADGKKCEEIPGYASATETEKEEVLNFYELQGKVWDFMKPRDERTAKFVNAAKPTDVSKAKKGDNYKNFYLVLYNEHSAKQKITIKSETPFALPQTKVTATAKKWDAIQVFSFTRDKKEIYDMLRYSYYNLTP